MHPSSLSADYISDASFTALLRQSRFLLPVFRRTGGHDIPRQRHSSVHPSSASATATTAACGGNREELLGPRPARHEHRSRCEVDAGSRNPEELFLRLCFGRAVFCCLFSGELGARLHMSGGCPAFFFDSYTSCLKSGELFFTMRAKGVETCVNAD